MISNFMAQIPIAVFFIGMALLILIACELGFWIGRHHHMKQQDKDAMSAVGPMVGGLLGMLAFVLAFIFSLASAQYDVRKQGVLNEANAVGTAYMRADLVDEPQRSELKRLLRDYVEVRLRVARDGDLRTALQESNKLHGLLWAQVVEAVRARPDPVTSAMAADIVEVADVHEIRKAAATHSRIPGSIWIGLVAITFLAMTTLGIQVGLNGKRRLVAMVPMSMAFAMLVTLVVDLDRPQSGLITVSQEAMLDLQETMGHRDAGNRQSDAAGSHVGKKPEP